jgi:hypothetical protein
VDIDVRLHGGPLDAATRLVPAGTDGQPVERIEFEEQRTDGLWYVEYRRAGEADDGWHFEATGNEERADEE